MHLGEITGWSSVALGQLVSWPQVLKLRRERGDGVSLASYAIVMVSMSLFLVHAIAIGDLVSTVSVPVSLIPNMLIAATLVRRRLLGATPRSLEGRSVQPRTVAESLVPRDGSEIRSRYGVAKADRRGRPVRKSDEDARGSIRDRRGTRDASAV